MLPDPATTALLATLRDRIARPGAAAATDRQRAAMPFGIPAIDGHLPGGGLADGALHEVAGGGADIEHGAAAALLIGGIVARRQGPVLWVLDRPDLFAPALDAVGLAPGRVVYAEAAKPKTALMAMEEGLRHAGLAAVVGEVTGPLTLTASRRLQLAAEQSGVMCLALRRGRTHDAVLLAAPSAAATRWRVAALPSGPALAHAPETPGLARPRWRLDLLRCRGAEPASWIVEACDATGHLGLSADLADRPAAPGPRPGRAAGGRAAGHRAA